MEELAPLYDAYPGLTVAPAVLLAILMRSRGRTVTYDHISAEFDEIMDYPPTRTMIAGNLKRLRQQLAPYDLVIQTQRELGLKLLK